MNKNTLIIDDDQTQALQLADALKREMPEASFDCAFTENDIEEKVVGTYYSIAIVDLRMDKFKFDGFDIIEQIAVVNPYAKVIVVSAYTNEYMERLNEYISTGKVAAIAEKEDFRTWIPKLKNTLFKHFSSSPNPRAVEILEGLYADAKNEKDKYKKGKKFEDFVVVLFRQMGFKYIETRLRDKASNEMDLIVRNDIDDSFFSKFKRYIFAECKNKPDVGFTKNDFIIFNNKVASSAGDSDLGVVFTTGTITKTVYLEALKESKGGVKIVYLASSEILTLIHSQDMLEEFKIIIDKQVQ